MSEMVVSNGAQAANAYGVCARFDRDFRSAPGYDAGVVDTYAAPPNTAPALALQTKVFFLYGLASFIAPPTPVQVFESADGPLSDYNPYLGNGPADYPSGTRFFRKLVIVGTRTTPSGSTSGTRTEEYTWSHIDLKFTGAFTSDDDDFEPFATDVLHRWIEQFRADNPAATDLDIAQAVAGWVRENSSFTETEWTLSLSADGRSIDLTGTLSDEDTFADAQARAADFIANATDAQWAAEAAGDELNNPFEGVSPSWQRVTTGSVSELWAEYVQNGVLWRPSNPSVRTRRTDCFVYALRYHHALAGVFTADTNGSWSHKHRVLGFPARAPMARLVENPALSSEPDPGDARELKVSLTTGRVEVTTDTWEDEALDGWFDEFGSPSRAADEGWADRAWVTAVLAGAASGADLIGLPWGRQDGVNIAVKTRIVALDGRAGWQGKIRNTRAAIGGGTVAVLADVTTVGGGASNVIEVGPYDRAQVDAGTFLAWSNHTPTVVQLADPDGVAIDDAVVGRYIRLEQKIRICAAPGSARFKGPTGKWFKRWTRTVETTSTATGDWMAFGGGVVSEAKNTSTAVHDWPALGAFADGAGVLASCAIENRLNGAVVDDADALAVQHFSWGAGAAGAPVVVTTGADEQESTVSYAPASSAGFGFVIAERFPIGWAGCREPVLDYSLPANPLNLLQAEAIATEEDADTLTDDMVRETRAAPYDAITWRTPWRSLVLADVDVVTCLTDGWALWTAPEGP